MAQKVRDVMTHTPITLPLDASITDAARIMRDNGIGDVLVTKDTLLCGMVTDRDLVVRALAEPADPVHTPLHEVCTAEVVSVGPDDDADSVVRLMRERAIRRVPVVEKGIPIGIVTIGDLAIERDRSSALADISAAPPDD